MKYLNRFIYAWGWLWLILCALVAYDVIDGMIRRWREGRYV